MKRILPFLLAASLGAYAFACSSSDDSTNNGSTSGGDGGTGGTDGTGTGGDGTTTGDGGSNANADPTKVPAPTVALTSGEQGQDSPIWYGTDQSLLFTFPGSADEGAVGKLVRLVDQSTAPNVFLGTATTGNIIAVANDPKNAGSVLVVGTNQILRLSGRSDAGVQTGTVVTSAYTASTKFTDAGAGTFLALNDLAVRKDGTIYVTDPGYQAGGAVDVYLNKLYVVSPTGVTTVGDIFPDNRHPNGVALSPDQKTLYVSVTNPPAPVIPHILKYVVNTDGSLGESTKFVDVGTTADSTPDGLAVDSVGNVFCATKTGVMVWKADGTLWGTIPVTDQPTGVGFGGADLKTLYIATLQGTSMYKTTVPNAGIAK